MEAKATLLAAKLEPATPALPLPAYAGTFGERTITLDGGALHSQRRGGPKSRLVPLGGNRFLIEADPSTKLDFVVAGGAAPAVEVIRGDGTRMTEARTD
jgi:hypothetical protein